MKGKVVIKDTGHAQVEWANGFKSFLPDKRTALLTANASSVVFCAEIVLKTWEVYREETTPLNRAEMQRAINQLSNAKAKATGMDIL